MLKMMNKQCTKYFLVLSITIIGTVYLLLDPSVFEDEVTVTKSLPSYFETRYEDSVKLVPLENMEQFFDYLSSAQPSLCTNMRSLGGSLFGNKYLDGQKRVCYDPFLKINDATDCQVLSFGINNEWSFDDAISTNGCQVSAFDPSMSSKNHRRSQNVTFYKLGISDKNGFIGNKHLKVSTYEDILNLVNLTNSKIAYLKMDIEGSEREFFSNLFQNSTHLIKNIEQIGVEIHTDSLTNSNSGLNPPRVFSKFWNYFQELEKYDFRLVNVDMNKVPVNHYIYKNKIRSSCYELLWVQAKFLSK